jgi:hypothetical protein
MTPRRSRGWPFSLHHSIPGSFIHTQFTPYIVSETPTSLGNEGARERMVNEYRNAVG